MTMHAYQKVSIPSTCPWCGHSVDLLKDEAFKVEDMWFCSACKMELPTVDYGTMWAVELEK